MSIESKQAPISCFSIPPVESLPEDVRERMVAMQQKIGFIPNVMRVLSRRPAEFRAFMAYHDVLMDGESGLSKAEREMIVVATSGVNHCHYCVVSHGAILRIRTKNPTIADQVAVNYHQAEITARERAILDYAMKVSRHSSEVSQADKDQARAAGLSDEDIWDIGSISAFFAMSNRLASSTEMRPNVEFYNMAR